MTNLTIFATELLSSIESEEQIHDNNGDPVEVAKAFIRKVRNRNMFLGFSGEEIADICQAATTEEKAKAINVETVKIDMTETDKRIAALTAAVGALAKKVTEQEETPAPSAEVEEDEIPKTPVEDDTQGEVGNDEDEAEVVEEGLILERAEIGKGFQIYRDYSNDTGKFNRLCR